MENLANRVASFTDACVQNELFEQTSDYLARGRRFENFDVDQLNEEWAKAFRQFVILHAGPHLRDMDDAGAELRLRGVGLPTHLVSSEVEHLRATVELISATVLSAKFAHDVHSHLEH